jgi:hypothetical protein
VSYLCPYFPCAVCVCVCVCYVRVRVRVLCACAVCLCLCVHTNSELGKALYGDYSPFVGSRQSSMANVLGLPKLAASHLARTLSVGAMPTYAADTAVGDLVRHGCLVVECVGVVCRVSGVGSLRARFCQRQEMDGLGFLCAFD